MAETSNLPRVVIVGGGFGGLAAARTLRDQPVEVTLIDRRNHHLFQPLLYQVATGYLSPSEVASPLREIFRGHASVRVLMGEVTGIDTADREVRTVAGESLPYDYLVLAPGSEYAYFGHDEWASKARSLKNLVDAIEIRRCLLSAFEAAEMAADDAEREHLSTFVVVGGGPTGVELAGAIADLSRDVLRREFRRVRPEQARVVLVEAGDSILAGFPDELRRYARTALEAKGVEVRLSTPVEDISDDGAQAGGERISAATVLWAAGTKAGAPTAWLKTEPGKGGRLEVREDLTVPGQPDVYVIGDAALAYDREGRPLPGLAPVAKQQGEFVGRAISDRVRGGRGIGPFRYRNRGVLATIGRNAAVADLGRARLKGRLAWLFWGLVHIFFLIGARRRLLVFLNWAWAYLSNRAGARIILEPFDPVAADREAQDAPTRR